MNINKDFYTSFRTIVVYDWEDIQKEICRQLDIPEHSEYYKYNDIEYDIWDFFLEYVIPDQMYNGCIDIIYNFSDYYFGEFINNGDGYKIHLAKAYNAVYNILCGDPEKYPGIYVQWAW